MNVIILIWESNILLIPSRNIPQYPFLLGSIFCYICHKKYVFIKSLFQQQVMQKSYIFAVFLDFREAHLRTFSFSWAKKYSCTNKKIIGFCAYTAFVVGYDKEILRILTSPCISPLFTNKIILLKTLSINLCKSWRQFAYVHKNNFLYNNVNGIYSINRDKFLSLFIENN